MSEQEAFEQFLLSDDFKNAGNLYGWKGVAESAWNAATAESNKRINALEGEVAAAHKQIELDDALKAQINTLREALALCNFDGSVFDKEVRFEYQEKVRKARLETPSESLQAFENDVLERAAKHLEKIMYTTVSANLVRELKGKV